jgi:hypothetical protein
MAPKPLFAAPHPGSSRHFALACLTGRIRDALVPHGQIGERIQDAGDPAVANKRGQDRSWRVVNRSADPEKRFRLPVHPKISPRLRFVIGPLNG